MRFTLPEAELAWRFSHGSGPGGQGVNTSDSRVELVWPVTVSPALGAAGEVVRERVLAALGPRLRSGALVVVAGEHRQQLANRAAARVRAQRLLDAALAAPPPSRRATRPTRGSKRRRAHAKSLRSATKATRRRPGTED